MGITDQKPRIATEEDVEAPWSGGKNGKYFRCKLCGHKFEVGDYYRFVFCKGLPNIIVCGACDKDDVEKKWLEAHETWDNMRESGPFWWFIVQLEDSLKDLEREAAYEERLLRNDIDYWRKRSYE